MSKHLETFYVFQRADGYYYGTEDDEYYDGGTRRIWSEHLDDADRYNSEDELRIFCSHLTMPGKIIKVQQKRILTIHKEVNNEY